MNNNTLNCWEPLKPHSLQHKDEKSLSVNVVKTEKSNVDRIRLNPKFYFNG